MNYLGMGWWAMLVFLSYPQPDTPYVHTYYNTLTGCVLAAQHLSFEENLHTACIETYRLMGKEVLELEGARWNEFYTPIEEE